MNNDICAVWLNLIFPVGSKAPYKLITHFGSALAVFEANDYSDFGLRRGYIESLSEKDTSEAERIYRICQREQIGILTCDSPLFPSRLKLIDNPPIILYYKGNVKNMDDFLCVAIVGSRDMTRHGEADAFDISSVSAKHGAIIISGLARGIDTAAHRGALSENGYTVGVLGTSIDKIFPVENAEIYRKMYINGLVISEYYPTCRTEPSAFPMRNRIISGLSDAVVVVEAKQNSGSLITAKYAGKYKRKLFAVPRAINDPYNATNTLIEMGASMISSSESVLIGCDTLFPYSASTGGNCYSPFEKTLCDSDEKIVNFLVDNDSATSDRIIAETGLGSSTVLKRLVFLELTGMIISLPGGRYKIN